MIPMISIVGGGIAGCSIALELSKDKTNNITIYEQNELLNNEHYCHAHYGLLYPDISKEELVQLTKETMMFIEAYPEAILYRPTIIAYNVKSKYSVKELQERCLIVEKTTKVSPFFKKYTYDDFFNLPTESYLDYFDSYVYNTLKFIKNSEFVSSIKFPFVCVKEYGIDYTILRNSIMNKILKTNNIKIINEQKEMNAIPYTNPIPCTNPIVIIATGSYGKVNVETKGSFTVHLNNSVEYLAEFVIIGERGTENGMFQVTPIRYNKLVIHKMSEEGSLGKFNITYINNIFSSLFTLTIISITPNIGRQEVNNSIEDRKSSINLHNGNYIIKLLKAGSATYIAKQMAIILKSK